MVGVPLAAIVDGARITEIEIIDKYGRRAADGWKCEMPEDGSDTHAGCNMQFMRIGGGWR